VSRALKLSVFVLTILGISFTAFAVIRAYRRTAADRAAHIAAAAATPTTPTTAAAAVAATDPRFGPPADFQQQPQQQQQPSSSLTDAIAVQMNTLRGTRPNPSR